MGPPKQSEFHFTLKDAERFNLHVTSVDYVYGVATAFVQAVFKMARLVLEWIDQPVVTASASRRAIPRKIAEQRLNAPRPLFDNATQKGDARHAQTVQYAPL